MLISTRGRYALQVMVDLAEHQAEDWIPLKVIARRQGISEKYLETILKMLVRQDLLVGLRGKGGGYRLTRAPAQYTVHAILSLTEDSLAPVDCLDGQKLHRLQVAAGRLLPLWQGLDSAIRTYLEGVTLQDIVSSGTPGNDYVI